MIDNLDSIDRKPPMARLADTRLVTDFFSNRSRRWNNPIFNMGVVALYITTFAVLGLVITEPGRQGPIDLGALIGTPTAAPTSEAILSTPTPRGQTGFNLSCFAENIIYLDNVHFPEPGRDIRKHGGYPDANHPLAIRGCVFAFDMVNEG